VYCSCAQVSVLQLCTSKCIAVVHFVVCSHSSSTGSGGGGSGSVGGSSTSSSSGIIGSGGGVVVLVVVFHMSRKLIPNCYIFFLVARCNIKMVYLSLMLICFENSLHHISICCFQM